MSKKFFFLTFLFLVHRIYMQLFVLDLRLFLFITLITHTSRWYQWEMHLKLEYTILHTALALHQSNK